jgi:hypothetical protein
LGKIADVRKGYITGKVTDSSRIGVNDGEKSSEKGKRIELGDIFGFCGDRGQQEGQKENPLLVSFNI